jgi:hypothetical protein
MELTRKDVHFDITISRCRRSENAPRRHFHEGRHLTKTEIKLELVEIDSSEARIK